MMGPGTEPLKVNAQMNSPGAISSSFSSTTICTATTRDSPGYS